MISALCWVPKGVSKNVPEVVEPPTKEEIEEAMRNGVLEENDDSDDDEEMDLDESLDAVAHAKAMAQALNRDQSYQTNSILKSIDESLRELDMDHYDDEDEGIEVLGNGLGDRYYPSNEMDPYLLNKDDDDEDEEEIEDKTIKPTDQVIVYATNNEDVNLLEVSIFEESDDGESNLYCHHEILLSAYPLCLSWIDCNLKGGDKGNFIAVGSMEPAIEIWDLDLIEDVQPHIILGGISQKCKGKKSSKKFRKGSHRDSVLGLAWNKEVRNVLASASADKTVKVWDLATEKCVSTLEHHDDKVQAIAWNNNLPEELLSGSFDKSVALVNMKAPEAACTKWAVAGEVESLAWYPHNEHIFVVSLDNGMIQVFDKRVASSNSDSASPPTFTLHAHEKAVTSVAFSPAAPNLMATASTDKMVKLWDISTKECIVSQNPKAGQVFCISFSSDSPFSLAIGGSKGTLQVWDTMSDPRIVNRFGSGQK